MKPMALATSSTWLYLTRDEALTVIGAALRIGSPLTTDR